MKTFIKDYKDLVWDPQIEFLRKHWLGTIAVSVGVGLVNVGYYAVKEAVRTKQREAEWMAKYGNLESEEENGPV